MRVLIDISHPAIAHVFHPVIRALEQEGHCCRVVSRDKDVTLRLLDAFGIPYQVLARAGRTQAGRLRELVRRELRLVPLARAFRPDLVTGTSVHAARLAWLLGVKSAVVNDDDAAAVPLFRRLAYPLASAIVTPDCLANERYGHRHRTYPSYHALFYLHPNRFLPDPAVRRELGPDGDEPYAVVRLSALEAHHDTGVRGLSRDLLRTFIARTRGRLRVFVTSEKPLVPEFEPYRIALAPERIHHALAFADVYLGDSQTMTAEAAVLGTPAFRLNDFVGRISYLEELQRYGLAFGFRPGREEDLLRALDEVLALPDRRAVFAERRRRLLADKIDPVPWLVRTLTALVEGGAA